MEKENYIAQYNKRNYLSFLLRIPKKEIDVIKQMNSVPSKNNYLLELIREDIRPSILSIGEIKTVLKEVLEKYDIHKIYLFGSYARGEAKRKSDVDILCERGKVNTILEKEKLIEEIETRLGKDADVLFLDSAMPSSFREEIERDLIQLC